MFTKSSRKSYNRRQAGFTLVEILVVVAIIGILAAVAIPNIYGMVTKAKVGEANAELGLVRTAIIAAMDHGSTTSISGDTISASIDIAPAVDPYIQGGIVTLHGVYTVSPAGIITTAGWNDPVVGWDAATSMFKKA